MAGSHFWAQHCNQTAFVGTRLTETCSNILMHTLVDLNSSCFVKTSEEWKCYFRIFKFTEQRDLKRLVSGFLWDPLVEPHWPGVMRPWYY